MKTIVECRQMTHLEDKKTPPNNLFKISYIDIDINYIDIDIDYIKIDIDKYGEIYSLWPQKLKYFPYQN